MRTSLVTSPAVEPLSLNEAKNHLRVEFSKEDSYIVSLIKGARQAFERETGRQLVTASWKGFLDRFPRFDREPIEIAKPPLQQVTSVEYVDTSGVEQTWSNTKYTVQTFSGPMAQRGILFPKPEQQYPDTRRIPNAVTVEFDAGYGDAASDVPQEIKEVLLAWIGHRYENREVVMAGQAATIVPFLTFDPWKDESFG